MENETLKKGFLRYCRPIPMIVCLSLLGAGSVSIVAMVNQMDVPTLIASLNTKQVTVDELRQGKLRHVILIDVRSPEEYALDHIGESRLVSLTDIEAGFGVKQIRQMAQENINSHQPQPTFVLYCTSGMRSVKAYKRLENTGLNFVVLKGGIRAWRQAVGSKDIKILAPITETAKPS